MKIITCLPRSLKCLQSQLAPVSACARALSTSTALHQQPQPATLSALPNHVRAYVEEKQRLCQPSAVHICDGSEAENNYLLDLMLKAGSIVPLPKYRNCYLARTDPADVARVESKTFITTERREETIPTPKEGIKGTLGNWMSPADLQNALGERFPGCMKGRTMYVIPFSMGPLGSPLSKIGIQLTDSPYVVASMRIMTRMGSEVLRTLGSGPFIKCLHSVGQPLPMKTPPVNNWPCNPEKTIITHIPDNNEICSFGSGYGGNSLLGKKCFALRLGSILAQREGWLAEHMLILGITNPKGQKKYIVAAFPSACGKTNLAMMTPTLPGYKAECVGDDIAWMKFDEQGVLRAINPEYGFFGVAPGTSMATNPNAMKTIEENTIFTNCPIIDPAWEDPKGVPISAILFGGRRPQGVPLVYEAFNWQHGVFIGSAMRSEATAAAEHKGKVIMHDPFAMRPFFGYNFTNYQRHWLSLGMKAGRKLPKIFHVNWFRKGSDGKFLWPGFGENSRVIDWICRRVDGENGTAKESPIGYLPSDGALNLDGLQDPVNMKELFDVNKDFWLQECSEVRKYFDEQLGKELPNEIAQELDQLEQRVKAM
ncbi:hypothetical protein MTO96_016801 [Rhipicephalus appendiculatus]